MKFHTVTDGILLLALSNLSPQAAGVPLKRKLWECKVTDDAVMPPGTLIGAAHFRAGQYLDITGTTKGKGFAGVMKRWNFAGQGASHGNTKHHRAPGSIGGRTDPGRVWKGKKMPGRLGGESMTFKNIWLYKVCGVVGSCQAGIMCLCQHSNAGISILQQDYGGRQQACADMLKAS